MKRAKKEEITEIKWKKIGNGSFILNNRRIKPGQVFSAKISDIPIAFRDVVIPLSDISDDFEEAEVIETKIKTPSSTKFKTKKIKDSDLVNIVNGDGKVINEEPLSKEEAKVLIKELED